MFPSLGSARRAPVTALVILLLLLPAAACGSLPATWGYYIGDELSASAATQVAALATSVRSVDPSHPLLYVGQSFPSLATNLQPFASTADVIGADVYPIGEGLPTSIVGNVAA